MKRVALVLIVEVLSVRWSLAATATFAPVGPTTVAAGTDVQMTLTVMAQTLPGIDAADILIGSTDATDLLFTYSAEWIATFDFVKPITPADGYYYPQSILIGGNNPTPVATPLLVGTLTIKTNGMALGTHEVRIDSAVDDDLSGLFLLGLRDPLFGTATFTIVLCPGAVQACCRPNGACDLIEADCCLEQGGTPQNSGATCQGDGDGDGIDELCGDLCAGFPNVDTDLDGVCDSDDRCPGAPDTIDSDGDGVPDCAQQIPVVSTWGLLILALLFLTGSKLNRGRGRELAGQT